MTRSAKQHQTVFVRRLRLCERLLCESGCTIDQIRTAIAEAGLSRGGGSGDVLSDKSVRRLIGSLEQLGVKINRTDSPGNQSIFRAVKSTRIFR